jgi:hypothetical protein
MRTFLCIQAVEKVFFSGPRVSASCENPLNRVQMEFYEQQTSSNRFPQPHWSEGWQGDQQGQAQRSPEQRKQGRQTAKSRRSTVTPETVSEAALVEKYFPMLRSIIQLGQAAETVLEYRPGYQAFLDEAKKLVFDFQTLCEAGNEEKLQQRFRSTICCIQAAQMKDKKVN